MPNPGRAEGANVGLVLVCPERKSVCVHLSDNNEAPKRLFRASSFDDARLAIAKESLAARLRSDLGSEPTLEGLRRTRGLEANSLCLTEPRTVAVLGEPQEVAEQLHRELVYPEPLRRGPRSHG